MLVKEEKSVLIPSPGTHRSTAFALSAIHLNGTSRQPLNTHHHRTILKNGKCNVYQPQSKKQQLSILAFNNLVGSSWLYTLLIFMLTLLISWFGFAVLYWLICYTHSDFEPNHLPHNQKQNHFKPCIYHINNFASCFLFSIESQHTVGYGIKATTDECPEAIFVNAFQCIIGFIMQGFMAVIIFAKMTLPRLRSSTLMFSKHAAISMQKRNKFTLEFRIGDMRKNHIIDANVRAFLVRSTKTVEGETLTNNQTELKLHSDDCRTSLFFNWPLVMVHRIDQSSPLFYSSPSDLARDRFEIIVILEGTIESTSQMTQAKTSYMSAEILWGKRFANLLEFNAFRKEFEVDFSKFDDVVSVSTPLCSAAYVQDYNHMQSKSPNHSQWRLNFTPRNSIGDVCNNSIPARIK